MEAAPIAKEISGAGQGRRFLVKFIGNAVNPGWKRIGFSFVLLIVAAKDMFFLLNTFGFAGFLDALPEVVE